MNVIDLRSDTVTRPDTGMYEALRSAPLGDDVLGDDPTVRRLEEHAAGLLGKEAGLFVPTGTMGNSIAMAVSARPGDEVLLEAQAHSLLFEVGGGARLWGLTLTPLVGQGGAIPIATLHSALRPVDIHLTRPRLLILEQTSNLAGGRILPLDYLQQASRFAREHGLAFHIDGARIFNAAVAAQVPVRDYAAVADSVMFCLSKGLGAPAGSMLVGRKDWIAEARRVRKLLGGGLRQAGVLAACGLHALERNVERLADDHQRALKLARALQEANLPGVIVELPETNMVYVRVQSFDSQRYGHFLDDLRGSGIWALAVLGKALRFVFHKDISGADADRATELVIRQLRQDLQQAG